MEGVPPSWTTYVNVEDADAVAAKVSPNGGNVLMGPMDVMDVGRMAIVADPVGAVIGIWQAGTHKGAGLVNEPNTYCWSELVTTDLPGAKAFYASVFGWGAESHGEDESAYVEWKLSGRSIGGLMLKPPTIPAEVPPYWGVDFVVDDADRAAARVGELGGSVMMGPTDIEPGDSPSRRIRPAPSSVCSSSSPSSPADTTGALGAGPSSPLARELPRTFCRAW